MHKLEDLRVILTRSRKIGWTGANDKPIIDALTLPRSDTVSHQNAQRLPDQKCGHRSDENYCHSLDITYIWKTLCLFMSAVLSGLASSGSSEVFRFDQTKQTAQPFHLPPLALV
jgi:hypothetical protein